MILAWGAMMAGTPAQAAGLTSPFTIGQMFPRELGYDMITSGPAITSPVGCSRTDAVRIVPTAANYQAIISTLIAAYLAGKTVKVWVTQCDTDGVSLFIAASVS